MGILPTPSGDSYPAPSICSPPLPILGRFDLVQGLGEPDLLHEELPGFVSIEPVCVANLEVALINSRHIHLLRGAFEQGVFSDGKMRNLVCEPT
jgi:hypothetical protein